MSIKNKLNELKIKAKWKYDDTKTWVKDNKEWLVVMGPVIVGSLVEITKICAKKGNVREERKLKENYIYDRSAGHYYETKRKLKSSEWVMVDERRQNGESYGQILRDMKLLK